MEEAKQNSNTEHDYFAKWQDAERKVAALEKKLEIETSEIPLALADGMNGECRI